MPQIGDSAASTQRWDETDNGESVGGGYTYQHNDQKPMRPFMGTATPSIIGAPCIAYMRIAARFEQTH
jgi:hypothetical protein